MMKANKQIGFININEESIDKIIKDGEVVFERGFLREKTSTTLPINFNSIGKDLKDYKIYGNTYQNSTTGKNLRYIEDETLAGISLTYNNKSGKISIRGTATKTDGIKLSKGGGVNIPAGTYTLSVSEPLPVLINSIVSLSSSTNVAFRMPAGNTSVTVNVPSDGVLADLYFAVTKDVTYDFDFYLQLEEGSVATEFEPFTNGASPNPGYPQEIISCGDKTKNKFLTPNVPTESNLATYSKINKNSFTLSYNQTTAISQSPYARIDFDITQFKPNTKYTISKKHTVLGDTFNSAGGLRSYINGANGNVINSNSLTFTTPNEISSLGVYFYLGYTNTTVGESQITFYDIQIEEGSVATEFEPYGYKIPVNARSENLFDKDNTNNLLNDVSINNNTSIISSGQTGFYTIKIFCKPNTIYTISKVVSSRFTVAYSNNSTFTSGEVLLGKKNNNSASSLTITTGENAKLLYVFYSKLSDETTYTLQQILDSIQIVEGSTVPDKYIPYYNETTNIYLDEPLRKIDGYSDYIDFINGKVVRNIDEIILNGSENLTLGYSQEFTNVIRIDLRYVLVGSKAVSKNKIMCDKFISDYGANTDYEHCRNLGVSYVDTFTIHINKLRLSDISTSAKIIESLKTWLSSNNITLDYVLETPTQETITLPSIPTVDGNNTLNIETEITPSQVYIKFKSNV